MIARINKQTIGFTIFSLLIGSPARAASLFRDSADNGCFMAQSGTDWMMPLFWIIIFGILIGLIRWIQFLEKKYIRALDNRKSAMEILKERLAKGEIDRDEYETRKKTLSQTHEISPGKQKRSQYHAF